ncbi:MAG: HAD-IIA family hydrolase [Actinomycetota bacterium]|nr:HAD-IIA family hydrolase [Actinomycetota bacterium]
MLKCSDTPLVTAYDLAVLDLDGVVYVGARAVPGAAQAVADARSAGMQTAFVTNNAARTPQQVAEHLNELGIEVAVVDVVTSAQAAAGLLSRQLPEGSGVFVIGGAGLSGALAERGFRPLVEPDEEPRAVVQGYGPDMPWRQVVAGAMFVKAGLPWVATNTDMTLPTVSGIGPGNGTLVRLVAEFAGREPVVAGKPERPLLKETLERTGGSRPLMVGDRLDSDIAGAHSMDWDSLLVLTGVTGLAELVAAPVGERPSYIGTDLHALGQVHPVPNTHGGRVELGNWSAHVDDGRLVVSGSGSDQDWWRVVAAMSWAHLDHTGSPVETGNLHAPPVA